MVFIGYPLSKDESRMVAASARQRKQAKFAPNDRQLRTGMAYVASSQIDGRPSLVGLLAQHSIHLGAADLERLGDVRGPHALRLEFAHP
jgi:hypothetical protein